MSTIIYTPTRGKAALMVLENDQLRIFELETEIDRPEKQHWTIGRFSHDPARKADIELQSPLASRQHAVIQYFDHKWYYADNPGNTNGTIRNGSMLPNDGSGERVYTQLKNGDLLRIDSLDPNYPAGNGVLMRFTLLPVDGEWSVLRMRSDKPISIGRNPACDIVEPFPYISAKHAEIFCSGGHFYVRDCGSKAGTFLNEQRVRGEIRLRERDCISLCDRNYFFLGDKLIYAKKTAAYGGTDKRVALKADIATKLVKDHKTGKQRALIKDIHLEIRRGTLVALLGTAGAGKSTVMNCINGMDLNGVQGTVLYNDVDLMENFERMKHLIGSVPQKKVFHPMFTPEKEFEFAAIKRLPADTSKQEIQQRVDKTLEMLSISGVRKNRNSRLSGGEQTRVNVGIELVADRDLLCLDEPDQGLSPNYKKELFEIMHKLAHENGKTVLCIIHDVTKIAMFDQVIMLAKANGVGRLAFSGSPAQARKFFGCDISEAYELLESAPERYVARWEAECGRR